LYEVNYLSKFFKMNMLEKINKSGAIKIIGKKLIVWDFSTYLMQIENSFLFASSLKNIWSFERAIIKSLKFVDF
ncbi:hypothetical protein, partial [Mesomycoplasma ovipneumoniae]|uniref:hypothetical protein n=1 Tax=Mesomycoplasma ovipneumoniae TaxID=29562 RepID=UPI0030810112